MQLQQNITKTFFLEATKGKKATNVLRTKKGILYEKESLAHLWEFTTDMISPILGPFHIKQHFHPEKNMFLVRTRKWKIADDRKT